MKLLFTYTLLFIALLSNHSFSQGQDFELKGFTSEYERDILYNEKSSSLELLMAFGDHSSLERYEVVKNRLNDFYSEIKNENLTRYNEVKLVKTLHKRIHDEFLKKYSLISPFHKIFENGEYNCVSATALLALTLKEFSIPFSIQELPTHVYIVAYPGTKDIHVEMTAPKKAYFMPSRRDISKSVDLLLEMKLTTKEEIQRKGEREIYNNYFFKNNTINLRELAGLQYYNDAIEKMNEEHTHKAFDAICKTSYLYPSEQTDFIKLEILFDFLDNAEFNTMREFRYLVEYANVEGANTEKAEYEYTTLMKNSLIMNGKRKFADSTFNYLSINVEDSLIRQRLQGIYYAGMSDYYANAYNITKQLEFAEKAFLSNPKNTRSKLWFIKTVVYITHEKFEGEKLVNEFDSYGSKYPYMFDHNYFQMFYYYACVQASSNYFFESDAENGDKYYQKAIDVYSSMEDNTVLDRYQVGKLYAEAGAYYYRQQDYDKALEIVNRGLELSPDHSSLETKKEIIVGKIEGKEFEPGRTYEFYLEED